MMDDAVMDSMSPPPRVVHLWERREARGNSPGKSRLGAEEGVIPFSIFDPFLVTKMVILQNESPHLVQNKAEAM
jgi:hypothetical protein